MKKKVTTGKGLMGTWTGIYHGPLHGHARDEFAGEQDCFYREIVENVNSIILRMDVHGNITFFNNYAQNFFGYSEDEISGKNVVGTIVPETEASGRNLREMIRDLLAFPERYTVNQNENIKKNGERVWVAWTNKALPDKKGGIAKILCVGNDITESKKAQDFILYQRDLALTLSAAGDFSKGLEICFDAILDISGMDCGSIHVFDEASKTLRMVHHKNLGQEFLRQFSLMDADSPGVRLILAGKPIYADYAESGIPMDPVRQNEGLHDVAIIPILYENSVIGSLHLGSRRVLDVPVAVRNRIELIADQIGHSIVRLKAREALADSEKRYRAVVEDMPAMICRFLKDGTLTYANRAIYSVLGGNRQDITGLNVLPLVPRKERQRLEEIFLSLSPESPMTTYETEIVMPDGRATWQAWTGRALFDENGDLMEYQAIGRDITENKHAETTRAAMEKQLRQSQKMEALGTLAGGIAHDFNNILMAVIGYAEMIKMFSAHLDDETRFRLEGILKGAHRAKELVRQILTFSRQTEHEKQPVHLALIVKEVIKFLRASLPSTLKIIEHIEQKDMIVFADATQMHQILMNLCTNAAFAMRETGGTIEVVLKEKTVSGSSGRDCPDVKPGQYALLSVRDTGCGMTPDILNRIFDPYFTTKKKGEGTGLGLSMVHGIVENHDGVIFVTSEPGTGSTFTVYIPLFEHSGGEAKEMEEEVLPGGNERILIVDDEEEILEVGKKVLGSLGYGVITKNNPLDALALFRMSPDSFDLVITDMTMPQMIGSELAVAILNLRPDTPIILCTGYNERISMEIAKVKGLRELLMKPFGLQQLAGTVRRVLDG